MPLITFPEDPKWRGIYEASPYRGTSESAAEFGIERSRLLDQDNLRAHRLNGIDVRIGRQFVRRVHAYNRETNTFEGQPASWQLIPESVYRTGVICAVSRDLTASPGDPMRDEIGGIIVVDDDGDGVQDGRPNQPAVGEQARDPWTGALLFDNEGSPVLVE